MPYKLLHPLSTVLFLLLAAAALGSEEEQAEKHPLIGERVNVHLATGETLENVLVEEVAAGDIPGTIARLRVRDPESGSRPIIGASGVRRVTSAEGAELLVFEEKSKSLAPPDEDKLAEIRRAAEAAPAPKRSSRSRPGRKAADKKRKPSPADKEQARRKLFEKKRREFFNKTGVWLWPQLTDRQQAEAFSKARELVAKVAEKFAPLQMRLYETRYFLFLSDLPPPIATLYTTCLDRMHERLCKAFGVKNKEGVWLGGKVPVFAFVHGEHFAEFEREFFRHNVNPLGAQGLAHQASSGEVVISCHCGKDPHYFASVIVHETTHGFVHRYKSPEVVPNWLNEGIAEWVAMNVVHHDKGVKRKVKRAIEQMRQTGSLGGDFFAAEHVKPNQYGIAAAMVDFMLRSNPEAFRAMIDLIKSGETWRDALKKSYGATPRELTQRFGVAVVGVPMLRP